MKVVIFGITGQDGSYLAELLVKKGYEVIGVTRRVSVNTLSRIEHILPQLTIVEGDITDGFNISKIIESHEPDEVYNLAAQSHVGTSFKQPSLTWDITGAGVLNILEAIRYSSRRGQIRFYQASSSEMFGKNYTTSENASLMMHDDKVVVDDGSCIFTAVTFYADSINLNGKGITSIDITVNGSVVGSFNGSYNSGNQICGETNTAVYNTNGESSVAWSAVIHQVDGVTVSSSGVFNGIVSESCVIQQVLP